MLRLWHILTVILLIGSVSFAANAASYSYSSTGSTAIPDGTGSNVCGAAITRTISVPDSFTIGDLNVGIIATHTYKEDLLISLQSPSGTNVTIVNREGGGSDNFNIRLDDAETSNIQSINHVTTNPYPEYSRQPLSSLASFIGENASGTWTLTVQDCWNADTGTLLDFYLEFTDTAGVNPLVVTSTADTNTIGTLRYAINHANANIADDNITFNIPGLGPHVISPTSALPSITDDGVTIDGSTQGSVVCNGTANATGGMSNRKHYIVLFGSNHSSNALTISGASNVTIKGLTIGNSAQSGIYADNADGLTLLCNHLGTSTDATSNIGNSGDGVRILNSDSVIIGDGTLEGANIVGFNTGNGIYLPSSGPSNAPVIKRNFIGVGPDGISDIGNAGNGLYLAGTTNAIIGGPLGEGNTVSGNTGYGVRLTSGSNIDVLGNLIGTSADGLIALPNLNGIYVTVSSNIRVGETLSMNRNIISGNTNDGAIFISTSNSQFIGNYIGVDASGNAALANGWSGLSIQNSTNISVGGTLPQQSNVLSGSAAGSGIYIYGGSSDITVENNLIGWGANGTTSIGNTHAGIFVSDSQAIIGGPTTASKNKIANNAYSGVVVLGTVSDVAILGNEIINNSELGIDLNFNSVSNNDLNDTDTGPNELLNFPVINDVSANGSTSVNYDISLDVPANSSGYRVEFYKNSGADPTNHGEGETFLGAIDVAGTGNHTGSFTAGVTVNTGDIITATTTRKTTNSFDITSEFSLIYNATSQTAPSNFLDEDFDDDACGIRPTGWIRSDNYVDEDSSTIDTAPCATSFRSADRWYQTPTLNLANESNMELSFFLDMNAESASDEFYVQYQSSGGSWITFGTWTNTTQNQRVSATLPAGAFYDGVNFRFLTGSTWVFAGNRTYIDTVLIQSSADPLMVTSTADTNTIGTLRYAINHANANAAEDDISFNISGTGPHKITLSSALPLITDDGINIDGSTQPGAACGQLTTGTQHTLMIHIDGAVAGTGVYGFEITGADVRISGLSVTNFDRHGISAGPGGANNFVAECLYVGVEPDGITSGPNVKADNYYPGVKYTNISNATLRNSLISGHTDDGGDYGVRFDRVTGGTIEGSIIGLNADGAALLSNAGKGIEIDGSSSSITIGGTTAALRNVISGNGNHGILVADTASDINIIGNYIGVGRDGTTAFGNGAAGIFLSSASTLTIGDGTSAGANLIAYNTNDGITLGGGFSGTGAILANNIHSNSELGIDIASTNGVNTNDSSDSDTGPNDLLNFPVLNAVFADGTSTIDINFELDVPAHTEGYRVDLFKNTVADGSGYGEGEIYLGFVEISHGGGNLSFSETVLVNTTVSPGDFISATTTRKTATAYDITSEFSFNATSVTFMPASLSVAKTVTPLTSGDYALPGTDVIYTLSVTNEGDGAVDTDTIILIDSLPAEIVFYNGDYDGPGPSTDIVGFQETDTSLSFDPNSDALFSNGSSRPADLSECTYTPSVGYDPNVKYVCFNPKGQMLGGDPDPNFSLSFRGRIQ